MIMVMVIMTVIMVMMTMMRTYCGFRTIRWLDRCIGAHKKSDTQSLFPIVQGGLYPELRKICAEGKNSHLTILTVCNSFVVVSSITLVAFWLKTRNSLHHASRAIPLLH